MAKKTPRAAETYRGPRREAVKAERRKLKRPGVMTLKTSGYTPETDKQRFERTWTGPRGAS